VTGGHGREVGVEASPGVLPTPTRRRGRKPIPSPPTDELRRLYVDERLSLEELGVRYSVSAGTVKQWLHQAKIGRRWPAWQTTAQAEHLRALYVDQQLSTTEIAARERVTPSMVWYALVYHQIPRRPASRRRKARPPVAELRRLYLAERRSIRQLAARYDVSYATVRGWLDEAGIPLRPKGGYWRWHSGRSQPR